MSENELIKEVQSGNIEAFEQLFDIYKNKVLRTAALITRNKSLSEDILQEVFIQCWFEIKKLKNIEAFKSWLWKIVVRISWKFSKKENKLIPVDNIFENLDNCCDVSLDSDINRILYNEINNLNVKQRTVIILFYFNDLKINEIAKITGCFEGTVKSRLYKARKNLKKSLEIYNKEGEKNAEYKCV